MPLRARLFALRFAAGSLLLGPAVATAAPGGDAQAEPETTAEPTPQAEPTTQAEAAAPGTDLVGSLRARGKKAKQSARKKTAAATGEDETLSKRTDRKWVKRWAPERNMLELGAFGGLLFPARDLELFEPRRGRPFQGFLPLATVAPDVGGRVGYYPLRFLGLEAEGAYMPTTTLEDGYPAYLWAARGQLVGQLPFSTIAPFVVVGGGALGINSNPLILGKDVDQAFHIGIGTKVFINRRLVARLDLRDEITPRRGIQAGATNSIEVLLGLSLTLGRERDRDGKTPVPEPEPQTEPPRDGDGDGFLDDDDACPTEAGVAPDGCPANEDPDGDGFLAGDDACPTEAGVAPDGCPDRDADHDGVLIPDDACPDVAEELNGFEDEDGCPDELPAALRSFNGRLAGVNFELSRATLTKTSLPVLDEAVKVLLQFPSIRIEVSGHTDNSGGREVNMRLSQNRAEAVKKYLVEHGVDAARITTRGAGPDEPIDSNATRDGRASNRRIEFRVLE